MRLKKKPREERTYPKVERERDWPDPETGEGREPEE